VKRYVFCAAALVLAAGAVAGCGSSGNSSGSGGGSTGGGQKKITLIQGVANEPFYISMYCGAKQEAAAEGVQLEVTAPQKWDTAMQTSVVTAVTAKKPNAVLIAPVDKEAMRAPVKGLADAGSKVIFVDTELSDTSLGLSRISSDNKLGGQLGAKALAKQISDAGKVLVLSPKKGIATTDDRVQGFTAEITANHPKIKVVSVQYPGDDAAAAQSVVTATLAANPDLAGIFADPGRRPAGRPGAGSDQSGAPRHRQAGHTAGRRRADREDRAGVDQDPAAGGQQAERRRPGGRQVPLQVHLLTLGSMIIQGPLPATHFRTVPRRPAWPPAAIDSRFPVGRGRRNAGAGRRGPDRRGARGSGGP
jgi:ABC-type sugar transport system substrate-binding protein